MQVQPIRAVLVAVALALTGCGADVPPAAAPAVDLALPVPTYAVGTTEGLVIVRGEDRVIATDDVVAVRFLPDGRALLTSEKGSNSLALLHPATGEVADRASLRRSDEPGRSVTRVNLLERHQSPARLAAHDLDLQRLETITLPTTELVEEEDIHDGPIRNYYGVAATVGDTSFVLWHDGSEFYEDGDYGVARIRHDGGRPTVDNVLINERLVALYLSADGSSLLALRQSRGEPCGGCDVDQEIVEIDPVSGALTEYGRPDGYDEAWRVDAMDRVGDRVAVRYVRSVDDGARRALVGTYVLDDGDWSLLPGSDEVITWWQDGGRVLARPLRGKDGYTLSWIAGTGDAETPIEGVLGGSVGGEHHEGSVPGQLLPPE